MNWDVIGFLNSLDPHGCGFFHLFVDIIAYLSGAIIGFFVGFKLICMRLKADIKKHFKKMDIK